MPSALDGRDTAAVMVCEKLALDMCEVLLYCSTPVSSPPVAWKTWSTNTAYQVLVPSRLLRGPSTVRIQNIKIYTGRTKYCTLHHVISTVLSST